MEQVSPGTFYRPIQKQEPELDYRSSSLTTKKDSSPTSKQTLSRQLQAWFTAFLDLTSTSATLETKNSTGTADSRVDLTGTVDSISGSSKTRHRRITYLLQGYNSQNGLTLANTEILYCSCYGLPSSSIYGLYTTQAYTSLKRARLSSFLGALPGFSFDSTRARTSSGPKSRYEFTSILQSPSPFLHQL